MTAGLPKRCTANHCFFAHRVLVEQILTLQARLSVIPR